jgi:outer membrane lipoprotein-sorting protein
MRRLAVNSGAVALALVSLLAGADAVGGQALRWHLSESEQIELLLRDASNAMAAVYDYRGVITKAELMEGRLVKQELEFKFSRPFKVYVKYLDPHPGREGIFVRGYNKDRLRAHRGSASAVAFSINPYGSIAMIDNHHPITDFGLENMLDVASRNIRKAIARGDATITLSDGGIVHGQHTWCIDLSSDAGGEEVVVRPGEDLWELATRVGQDMYVILHHNPDVSSPTDVRAGETVFVPHYYASRGQYFIGKHNYMMIKAVSWDHAGKLYERYEYAELELNPGLTNRDFDYRSSDYGFVPNNQR